MSAVLSPAEIDAFFKAHDGELPPPTTSSHGIPLYRVGLVRDGVPMELLVTGLDLILPPPAGPADVRVGEAPAPPAGDAGMDAGIDASLNASLAVARDHVATVFNLPDPQTSDRDAVKTPDDLRPRGVSAADLAAWGRSIAERGASQDKVGSPDDGLPTVAQMRGFLRDYTFIEERELCGDAHDGFQCDRATEHAGACIGSKDGVTRLWTRGTAMMSAPTADDESTADGDLNDDGENVILVTWPSTDDAAPAPHAHVDSAIVALMLERHGIPSRIDVGVGSENTTFLPAPSSRPLNVSGSTVRNGDTP